MAASYDWSHRKLRARWRSLVDEGGVCCRRCGKPIAAGAAWDLGHDDHDPEAPAAPEHRRCNRATVGRRPSDRARGRKRRAGWYWLELDGVEYEVYAGHSEFVVALGDDPLTAKAKLAGCKWSRDWDAGRSVAECAAIRARDIRKVAA